MVLLGLSGANAFGTSSGPCSPGQTWQCSDLPAPAIGTICGCTSETNKCSIYCGLSGVLPCKCS